MKKCPFCEKEMTFYIEGNFGGAVGVFKCECGFIDKSSSNLAWATEKDVERFYEESAGMMW